VLRACERNTESRIERPNGAPGVAPAIGKSVRYPNSLGGTAPCLSGLSGLSGLSVLSGLSGLSTSTHTVSALIHYVCPGSSISHLNTAGHPRPARTT
jgi:hypothetical protein